MTPYRRCFPGVAQETIVLLGDDEYDNFANDVLMAASCSGNTNPCCIGEGLLDRLFQAVNRRLAGKNWIVFITGLTGGPQRHDQPL